KLDRTGCDPTKCSAASCGSCGGCFDSMNDSIWGQSKHFMKTAAPFWDYMRKRWERNGGLRIDHLLLNPEATARLIEAGVDKAVRGKEGASDHAPAWIVIRR